jgi:hypothetical protein
MREWFERVPSHGLPVHIEWFPTFSQELLENLPAELPFEVLAGLEEDRRDAANAYAQSIRVMGDEAKQNLFTYLRFLREKEKPEKVAAALCHFKFFLHCYASGATEAGRQVMRPARRGEQAPQPYTNERLRAVLGELSPVMLSAAAIQQDAADGVRVIQDLLLPRHLQLQVESWTYYNTRGKPPLVGERVVDGCATIEQARSLSPVLLPPKGDALNIQNLIHRFIKDRNPEGRIVSNGYEYQKSKIENKFTSAPDSLWLFVNRQHMFRSPWVGLHRLMPDWFDARPPIQTKYEFSIEAQETIEVPTNGGLSRYTLDGFIWHQGADGAGHYISYVRKKDADGKDVWFELNDSVVTRLTDERMREFCSKSLIYHYSKID